MMCVCVCVSYVGCKGRVAYLVGLEVKVGGGVDVGRVRVGNPVGVERTTALLVRAAGTARLGSRVDDPPPVLGGQVDARLVLGNKARACAESVQSAIHQSNILVLVRVHVHAKSNVSRGKLRVLHRGSPCGRPHRLGGISSNKDGGSSKHNHNNSNSKNRFHFGFEREVHTAVTAHCCHCTSSTTVLQLAQSQAAGWEKMG